MTVFDTIVLAIAAVFFIIGIWKGFVKLMLNFGALILAVILAKTFGGIVGGYLFPKIIQGDSSIGGRLAGDMIDNVNASLATVIGTILLFVALFIIFKIISAVISKLVTSNGKVGAFNKILGGLLGLAMAAGVVMIFAVVMNIAAAVISMVNPENTIYQSIEQSMIFKHFFFGLR